jgi:YD repeat-containing protein
MVSSAAPESGQTNYQYDGDGNVTQISDARGITTTTGYDGLSRPVSKTYSDGTPSVSLNYDEASPWGIVGTNNTVGRLSSASVAGNLAGSIYIYDSMGRLVRNDQCGKSVCGSSDYPVYASYDYAGDLTSLSYPSGRTVVNTYNNAARLTQVNYASFSGTGVNYPYYTVPQSTSSTAWGYFPSGALNRFTFGPGTSEILSANSRLMLNQITASTSAQTLLSKTYGFMSPNNGNITQVTDNLNNGRTQNFGYDYLNRLT